MTDTLPLWFWLPPAIVGWVAILIPVFRFFLWAFGADNPDPDDRTPLDELEMTGSYTHG
ncbi:hypothetical protein [Microbacterium sp. NPDC089696]|uniref:hypothetical protein n=1 Tax=Microbacterium sp. NPDC089696 TaxID=3364199 RepID=UPI00381485AD